MLNSVGDVEPFLSMQSTRLAVAVFQIIRNTSLVSNMEPGVGMRVTIIVSVPTLSGGVVTIFGVGVLGYCSTLNCKQLDYQTLAYPDGTFVKILADGQMQNPCNSR